MARAPPRMATRVAVLFLRALTFASLLISLNILTINSESKHGLAFKICAKGFNAYRYLLATTVVGISYTLLQIAFSLYHVRTGNRVITGDGSFTFDFYGDKVVSYALVTGAAAAIGVTKDLKDIYAGRIDNGCEKLFDKGYACAGLVLSGFLCTALLSIYSSYALPKRV